MSDPANDSDPAFDVVCPSLPGFGFSEAPHTSGMFFTVLCVCAPPLGSVYVFLCECVRVCVCLCAQ